MSKSEMKPREFWIANQGDDLSLEEDIICEEKIYTKNFEATFCHVIEFKAYQSALELLCRLEYVLKKYQHLSMPIEENLEMYPFAKIALADIKKFRDEGKV